MSTPDDNIVVEQRMATSSTSQVEELGISGLPVAIPFRTMVERRLSWTDSAVATRRQASRRQATDLFLELCLSHNMYSIRELESMRLIHVLQCSAEF
jgi:hypothetical protein